MTALEIQLSQIWGDDEETQVFAHVHDEKGSCLTFRISQNNALPLSLESRIVACFHELPVASTDETFEERAAMRMALKDAAREAWPNCIHAAQAPDAIVDLYGGKEGHVDWHIQYESTLYQHYLQALSPVAAVLMDGIAPDRYHFVNYKDLAFIYRLPGRGTSCVVRQTSADHVQSLYVLKGVEFSDFLASRDQFMHDRDVFYRTIKTISLMPPHPNIQPSPHVVAVAGDWENQGQALLCGTLYSFMARGTLDDQVIRCKSNGTRIGLQGKALWCFQLSSALAHTHHVGHTYHMDIKPANVVVDDHGNAILIDWEQSGAPLCTLAPEVNGEWDVEEISQPGASSRLVYTRYNGPTRVNLPMGRPEWNVFPEWNRRWPRACEAAEVYSLGRAMWMLLQEVPQDDIADLDPKRIVASWNEDAADIPDTWKAAVMSCLEPDPNQRIVLTDIVQFWELQQTHLKKDM